MINNTRHNNFYVNNEEHRSHMNSNESNISKIPKPGKSKMRLSGLTLASKPAICAPTPIVPPLAN